MEARKGLQSQEPPRSHHASSRWPCNGSGRAGGPATLAPRPPGGVGGKQGKRKEPRAQQLPVWPGTPHTPGRHTCSFAEPSRAGGVEAAGPGTASCGGSQDRAQDGLSKWDLCGRSCHRGHGTLAQRRARLLEVLDVAAGRSLGQGSWATVTSGPPGHRTGCLLAPPLQPPSLEGQQAGRGAENCVDHKAVGKAGALPEDPSRGSGTD